MGFPHDFGGIVFTKRKVDSEEAWLDEPEPMPDTSVIAHLAEAQHRNYLLELEAVSNKIDMAILKCVQIELDKLDKRLTELEASVDTMKYVGDRMANKLDGPLFKKEWEAAKDGIRLRTTDGKLVPKTFG